MRMTFEKFVVATLIALFLASTAVLLLSACTTTGALTAKPSQVDVAVTAQKAQQDFQWACAALTGMHVAFNAFSPLLKTSLDANALNAEADAASAITTICAKPLDLTNVQGTVQQIMDAAGRIAKVIADTKARAAATP